MYVLASRLTNLPIISLQTGETVATITSLVIAYEQLNLLGFIVNAGRSPRTLLVVSSIRQLAPDCVVIDSEDELSEPDDVIRLQPLLEARYTPLGKKVQTESGHVMGTVEEYTINIEDTRVQKLYIKPPLLRSWYSSSLIVDRAQIIDVQPQRIIVRDATLKLHQLASNPAGAEVS